MIAFIKLCVIRFSAIFFGSILNVSDCISENIGIAFAWRIHDAVAVNVYGVVITSFKGLIPEAIIAACSADVPELNATAYLTL